MYFYEKCWKDFKEFKSLCQANYEPMEMKHNLFKHDML